MQQADEHDSSDDRKIGSKENQKSSDSDWTKKSQNNGPQA